MVRRMPQVGEANHWKGAEGAERAKRWLDSTTRTISTWTNKDEVHAARLSFRWPHAQTKQEEPFSFDLGGILYGDEYSGHQFVAEVKNYSAVGNIGDEWDDFLAKAYYVAKHEPKLADQFMFITWNPFRATHWSTQKSPAQIAKACITNRVRLLGEADESAAHNLLDSEVLEGLSERLWLIVLSDKQETLLISNEDRSLIISERVMKGLL